MLRLFYVGMNILYFYSFSTFFLLIILLKFVITLDHSTVEILKDKNTGSRLCEKLTSVILYGSNRICISYIFSLWYRY